MLQACLKCKIDYEEQDSEAYYCPSCLKVKKSIADQIDAKFANRSHIKPKTLLEMYDEAPKTRGGFPDARNFL